MNTVKELWQNYILQILIAIDQLIKVIIWGGNPDITISDYAGRNYSNTFINKVINTLFFWEKNHTKLHYEADEKMYEPVTPVLRFTVLMLFIIILCIVVLI